MSTLGNNVLLIVFTLIELSHKVINQTIVDMLVSIAEQIYHFTEDRRYSISQTRGNNPFARVSGVLDMISVA